MREIIRNVLQTYSGKVIDLESPQESDITICDICEGLSKVCRFAGQVREFYSVAAHTLHVYNLISAAGGTREERLYGLLHDASEAYIGDMPSPIKKKCPEYYRYEKKLQDAIYRKFGLDPNNVPAIVKWADDECLDVERQCLFGHDGGIEHGRETRLQIPLFASILYELDRAPTEEELQWLRLCYIKYSSSLRLSIQRVVTSLRMYVHWRKASSLRSLTRFKEQCINTLSQWTKKLRKTFHA